MCSKSSSLFAFDNDWSFLDIDEVDRINGLGFAWNCALNVLWRDDSHGLDHSNARSILGRVGLRGGRILHISVGGQRCRWLLDRAIATTWLYMLSSLDYAHL